MNAMKHSKVFPEAGAAFALLTLLAGVVGAQPDNQSLQQGATFDLAGHKATLTKLDMLPFVESDYTKRFKFDSFDNPKLKQLREHYKLDEVVAPGRDEFEKQVLLMDWAHDRFKKFGRPATNARGALEILHDIDDGQPFFCTQYAQMLVSAAASLGWVDRPLALRRHQGVAAHGGSTEHTTTEIWSNQHRKWVMLDPTSDMYLEKDGAPLNAYEIRREWFYHDGKDLVFVVGKEHKKYRKSDLPVFLQRFPDFGDLTIDPDELDKYGFTAYVPNTNLMDAGLDYDHMFIVQDHLCDGTQWHKRTIPANPATDPYFPIGQAALALNVEGGQINVALKTMTPNFSRYEVRIDGGGWKPSGDRLQWHPHPGSNRLEARTANQFSVFGPISTAEVEIAK